MNIDIKKINAQNMQQNDNSSTKFETFSISMFLFLVDTESALKWKKVDTTSVDLRSMKATNI